MSSLFFEGFWRRAGKPLRKTDRQGVSNGMRRWRTDQGTEKPIPSHDPNWPYPQQNAPCVFMHGADGFTFGFSRYKWGAFWFPYRFCSDTVPEYQCRTAGYLPAAE